MKSKPPPKSTGLRGATKGIQTKSATLSRKEQLKRAKAQRQWRQTMDFLFRQLATITYRFNVFFSKELTGFSKAMSDGDDIRAQLKIKKSDQPRIWNVKTMLEAADLLESSQQPVEAEHLRTLADLSGRIRSWGLMVAELQKMVTVEDDDQRDEIKFMIDSIQGLTNRTVDFNVLKFIFKIDLSEFTELEKQYLKWPLALRTALFHGSRFLKMISDLSGVPLMPETDPTYLLRNMQAAEFILALNMDDLLNERNTEEEQKMKLLLGPSAAAAKQETWERPNVDDVEPELMQPIEPKSLLLHSPVAVVYTRQKKEKEKKRKGF